MYSAAVLPLHGGKDGIHFPVNRKTYDSVIDGMDYIIDKANIEQGIGTEY